MLKAMLKWFNQCLPDLDFPLGLKHCSILSVLKCGKLGRKSGIEWREEGEEMVEVSEEEKESSEELAYHRPLPAGNRQSFSEADHAFIKGPEQYFGQPDPSRYRVKNASRIVVKVCQCNSNLTHAQDLSEWAITP